MGTTLPVSAATLAGLPGCERGPGLGGMPGLAGH